ncbi:MAG TPA: hypothetical protein VL995_15000 [Cellvibrio sp.]|nr:hypothetical protein [Cellvibrio sp.]
MKSASLVVGQHLILNNQHCEIIRILENDIVQLESKNDFKLINRTKMDLLREHENGELKFANCKDNTLIKDAATHESKDLSAYSEEQQQIAKLRMDYIRMASSRLGSEPQYAGLDRIIPIVAANTKDQEPPSPITVYRWWHRWEDSLHDITSLVPKKRVRGYTNAFKKPVLKMLNEIINDDYLQRERATIQDAYDRLKALINSHNKTTTRTMKAPSRATVYRYFENLDPYEVLLAKKGKRAAKQKFRSTGSGIYPDYILGRTEIDHTPLDLFVVDDKTFRVLGRPNLTCIIDKASRAILGFSLSFEPPSELSVIRALRHALFTKTNLKTTFPDLENEWHAYGIPMCLVVDNGLEFHSKMLRQLCYELNIELVFCPKQEPQFKGCIERVLGSLNREVSHKCAGTSFNNITARGDYPSVEKARVTLKEAHELITHWIVDVYHQRPHSTTRFTPDYLWKEGLSKVQPRLPESKDAFALACAKPVGERKLTNEGVRYEGLLFNSTELQSIRRNPNFTGFVNARINHENLGFIWVHDEYNDEYIRVECREFEYANDLTLLQHKKIGKEDNSRSDANYDEDRFLQGKERLRNKVEKLKSHSLLRERKKAARIAFVEGHEEYIATNFEQHTQEYLAEHIGNLDDIPEFDSYQLGGFDHD